MSDGHLKIGKISYTNLFPIFYTLEKSSGSSAYELVEGVPSLLNRMLREGTIDISPSSSIEFLGHPETYSLLEGHSISAIGPIRSILLFSTIPMEELDGMTLLTTAQSETSVALLDIIMKKFYNLDCPLQSSSEPLSRGLESHPAYLLIGDDALTESHKWPKLYINDLADIWHKKTGLPFVFALWIARKDRSECTPELFEHFRKELDAAKLWALQDLRAISKAAPLRNTISEDEILSYWKGISYDLTDGHKRGLALFRDYALELKLI